MAICEYCDQEMNGASGCVAIRFRFVDDEDDYEPIKYGDEADDWDAKSGRSCRDCDCLPGNYHHAGCDVERCPRCSGQAIGCDCDLLDSGS